MYSDVTLAVDII